MKILIASILIFTTLNAIEGMKNITLNTLDSDEVNSKVATRINKIKIKNLTKVDCTAHQNKIKTFKNNISRVVNLKHKLRESKLVLAEQQKNYDEHNSTYQSKIDEIYADAKNISRESYYIVTHKLEQEPMPDLQNYLVDRYGVTQFEQSMVVKENSNGSSSFKNIIKTTKNFGQMQIETLKDYTFREKNINFKLLKVIQSPFAKSEKNLQHNSIEGEADKFAEEGGIKVYQLSSNIYNHKDVIDIQDISAGEKLTIISDIDRFLTIKEVTRKLNRSTKKIQNVIHKIEKIHDAELVKLNKYADVINSTTSRIQDDVLALKESIKSIEKIAKEYNLEINLDEIDKLIVVAPKIYTEYVELGEEKEFILRKTKLYLSKITTKNSDIQKMIEYESMHIFPFVEGKKLGLFIFSTIEIEDKATENNYVTKQFQYAKLEFVPINRGYKTIFAANTELTIGIVKEFLQTHRQNKYFDEYCLEDSYLPEDAKDMKNASEEFYDYPAVCMKIDKIEDLMKWLSISTGKELVIPSVVDWSYIASNANSSDYCWGNMSIEEMNKDGVKHENIYYEDGEDTTIQPVKQYTKSTMGMYDMCGNVHELVKDGEVFMVKGNSFISYVEKSDAPAMDYGYDLSPSLGLRVIYTTGE